MASKRLLQFTLEVNDDHFTFFPYRKRSSFIRIRKKDLFLSSYDIDKIVNGFVDTVLETQQNNDDIPVNYFDIDTPEGYVHRRLIHFLLFDLNYKKLYTKIHRAIDSIELALEIVEKIENQEKEVFSNGKP